MIEAKPENLIGDRAYDSDPLDEELRKDGIAMIAPHRSNRSKPPTQDRRRLIPKLADPDSCCERPTGTFIAKTYGGPMGYGRGARTRTVAQMSQCLRSLV